MLECKATLRIKSDKLSLEEICTVMGEPSKRFTKGQEFGKAKRSRPHTQWNLEIDLGNENMQDCLMKILEIYNASELGSIRSMCDVDVFCMLSSDNGQGSFILDNRIYQKMNNAGLTVVFDFYSD
tara:strand:+ start:1035 stop:1409 length:375 start_codon:yes stop_codon:yes gene_type:complete